MQGGKKKSLRRRLQNQGSCFLLKALPIATTLLETHGDQTIEIHVRRRLELQDPEADVVQRLVVDAERLVAVLDQLVHRQNGVVRLDHHLRHLETAEM